MGQTLVTDEIQMNKQTETLAFMEIIFQTFFFHKFIFPSFLFLLPSFLLTPHPSIHFCYTWIKRGLQ